MQGVKTAKYFFVFMLVVFFLAAGAHAAVSEEKADAGQQVVGQIFNTPVPVNNYYFIKSALAVFGNRWGTQPQSAEEFEDQTWEQIVLSFEAFRRNIAVSQEELSVEIERIMKQENVSFDWKKDKDAYSVWVKEKTNEPVELFQNQLRHLLQIQKLRDEVKNSLKPMVTEEEARQAFLDEQNHLELEIAQFDNQQTAQQFFAAVKDNPGFWDAQKEKTSQMFKQPGMVTIIFLNDIWKLARQDLYAMLSLEQGAFYQPAPMYKGFAVFRVLGKRPADESKFASVKNAYYDRVAVRKQYAGLQDWLNKLKQDANITIFKKGG